MDEEELLVMLFIGMIIGLFIFAMYQSQKVYDANQKAITVINSVVGLTKEKPKNLIIVFQINESSKNGTINSPS